MLQRSFLSLKKKKAEKLNPRTSLLPRQPKLFLYPPHVNNHSAQVGRLLFHIDENSSRETWNHGKLPLSRPEAKPFPPSCLLRSESSVSLSPTGPSGPAQPTMKGFLSCFWSREFFFAQISVAQRDQLHFSGYLTPTASMSEVWHHIWQE